MVLVFPVALEKDATFEPGRDLDDLSGRGPAAAKPCEQGQTTRATARTVLFLMESSPLCKGSASRRRGQAQRPSSARHYRQAVMDASISPRRVRAIRWTGAAHLPRGSGAVPRRGAIQPLSPPEPALPPRAFPP